jgi:two-component system NarL family sensor kinase
MYSNLSGIYEYDSIYDKAENYINKAIKIYKKKNNNLGLARATNNLGNIFLSKKEYAKAKDIYLEALSFIKNNNNSRAIRVKAKLYYNLAWSMRKLKDYKAYDFQEMSYDIEDTIREKEFRGIIDRLSSEFDFDLQKKLFDKQKEVILLKEKDKVRTIGVIGALIFIVLLIVIGYINLRKKNLHLKLSQIELIQIQNLEKLKSESQSRILNATIDGKESERKEIAETLHDNVSALLSSANLHLQAVRKQFNGEIPTEINKTRDIITEASKKIRDLSHTLVSSVLLKFGLNFAIKDIAEKFSNSDLEIETDIRNIRRYHQKFEIKVNNIIQELVNNVLKHSKASKAIINIREHDSKLIIEIIDNGLGFDKTQISLKDGLGINQIDARIQMMKGHFYIKSSFNNGTSIRVELPIQEKEQVILS